MQFFNDHQSRTTRIHGLRLAFALAASTAALVACGGGGGDDSSNNPPPPPPPVVDPSVAMRGFWSGALTGTQDGSTRASAVVMPDGTAWVVTESTTAVVAVEKVALTGTGVSTTDATVTGSGFHYRLADGVRTALTASGTASTAGTFKGTATVTGSPATSFNWTSTAGFATQSVQGDLAGTWNGTVGTGVVTLSWGISGTGAVTGTSSTGCNYSGSVTPATGTAVYTVAVNENCQGTVKALAGIATLVASKTSLRVVFTSDAGATAGLFSLTKQ